MGARLAGIIREKPDANAKVENGREHIHKLGNFRLQRLRRHNLRLEDLGSKSLEVHSLNIAHTPKPYVVNDKYRSCCPSP